MKPLLDQSEHLDAIESLDRERKMLEAQARAGGKKFEPFKFSDESTENQDFILKHDELEKRVTNLRALVSQPLASDAPSTPPTPGASNPPTLPAQPGRKLNATERARIAIEHSKKPEVIAAAKSEKEQRASEYFDRKAHTNTDKPLSATAKLLKAEGVSSLKELAEKRQKARALVQNH